MVFTYFETLPLMCYFQFIVKHVFMQNVALIILIYNPNNLLYVNLITKILVNNIDNLQWHLLLQADASNHCLEIPSSFSASLETAFWNYCSRFSCNNI